MKKNPRQGRRPRNSGLADRLRTSKAADVSSLTRLLKSGEVCDVSVMAPSGTPSLTTVRSHERPRP